jgi:carbon storage regulator
MLVLSRKVGERIWIGPEISVTIVRIAGGAVRLGINAPAELAVVREELKERIEAERIEAGQAQAAESDAKEVPSP